MMHPISHLINMCDEIGFCFAAGGLENFHSCAIDVGTIFIPIFHL